MKFFTLVRRPSIWLLLVSGIVGAVTIWSQFDFPTSYAEIRFIRALKSETLRGAKELNLSELMPGEWELVCGSSGYDSEFYLKQYNRTFPAVGASQDGSWGLLFIAKDGSYKSAVGNCGSPGVYLNVENCTKREHAALSRVVASETKCLHFAKNAG